ncbi:unnamed protein product [Rotaria sordida]|uniref:CCHC-type domain-containing protein n=1 Tax=Rotaria sordida TaxID=392033 RepID=A0A818XLB5_9BILA|nr:unnamed protein product [Rotaria sordida]CAF3742286.1 unnamed protein product [Rotaria sordida]
MNDQPKKSQHKVDCKSISDLVKLNAEKNNKNHRPQIQLTPNHTTENKTNLCQQQKQNHIQNIKSTPKPLLECLKPEPLLTSKPYEKSMSQRRRKNKPFDRENLDRIDDDRINNGNISSPEKIDHERSTIDIREPTSEHLLALKKTFNKILTDRSLSYDSLNQRQLVFTKLHQFITKVRTDCQINLYGSIYFECCLEKPGVMDIDIRFKETSQYDILKELLDLIKKSDLCKEAQIDTEHKPSCINLITNEPNMRVKITSGYNRGLYLSKLIRLYIKFDQRVIKLLRLFRILTKTCNIDKPELGTLHPVVFHIMVIHFLQQLDQPILPCLHEYAYGIDRVPITLNENQYTEFFNVCEKYSYEWKSKNTTSVEMLFLQLLSYYVKTFNSKQFVVSIQTRMPIMKIDKNWRSRKLLVEDPTDIKRSLCQTMQSMRSIEYFRSTLNASLNYFARKQKQKKKLNLNQHIIENTDDDFVEIIPDDIPTNEPINSLHNSYKLFYKHLPPTIVRDINIKQGRVREYYKRTFDNENNKLSKAIIQLNSLNNKYDNSVDNDIQEAFQHDLENNFEITDENDDDENENHSHLLEQLISHEDDDDEQILNDSLQQINIEQQQETICEESPTIDGEDQSIDDDELSTITNDIQPVLENIINDKAEELHNNLETPLSTEETSRNDVESSTELHLTEENTTKSSCLSPINIKTNSITTNNDNNNQIPSAFISPIKLEQIINDEQSTNDNNTCIDNSSELFYDFRPENFHAEQGAPYVCTTCNGVGHLKNECPELIIPNMIDLPAISEQWIDII